LDFSRMPADPAAVKLAYAADSGITVHGAARTRFLYLASNRVRADEATPDAWRPDALPPGDYIVRAHGEDAAGNRAIGSTDLPVRIGPGAGTPPGACVDRHGDDPVMPGRARSRVMRASTATGDKRCEVPSWPSCCWPPARRARRRLRSRPVRRPDSPVRPRACWCWAACTWRRRRAAR